MGLVSKDDGWRIPDWLWERIEPLPASSDRRITALALLVGDLGKADGPGTVKPIAGQSWALEKADAERGEDVFELDNSTELCVLAREQLAPLTARALGQDQRSHRHGADWHHHQDLLLASQEGANARARRD
jgi:hypothetical protein